MSEPPRGPLYVVDTSALMEWQSRAYPTDVFSSLIDRVDGLVSEGRFIAPSLVQEELGAVGTAELIRWAGERRAIFIALAEVLAEAKSVQDRFPGLRDPKAEYEEADAYVIALARMRDGIVVTQETAAAEKRNPKRSHFIPDVCRELGMHCINLLGLMRRENWKL